MAGLVFTRVRKESDSPSPAPSDEKTNKAMEQQQREQLRSEYKLRPLNGKEEGLGIANLPNGVYGFSYAPATETPLFAKKSYRSFEVQKLSDGSAYVVGFVSAADAERLRARNEEVEVTVYPDPYEEASTIVSIPFDRVLTNLYKPIRTDGNALPLKLAAV